MARYFLVIINPISGKKNKKKIVQEVHHFLNTHQAKYTLFYTKDSSYQTGELSEKISEKDYTDILIIGGDGTIHEVVNSMHDFTIPISIIAVGTGNDFIKNFSFEKSIQKQLKVAWESKSLAIDLGVCNGRYFLNGIGIGFDGQVVAEMEKKGKIASKWSYLLVVLKILSSFKERSISLNLNKEKLQRNVFMVTIGNGTTFGNAFRLTPNAQLDDGLLDICLVNTFPSILKRFLLVPRFMKGTHIKLDQIEYWQGSSLFIEKHDQLVAHIDGEYLGHPPFEISLKPKSLLVRTPQH